MASMTEADFGSDTDDDDYMPEGETQEVSEEENSGEDENPEDKPSGKNKKKRKTKKTPAGLTGRKNVFDEEEDKVDWKKALEEEKKELDEEKKKQKENDIWAAFKKDTSVKAAPSKPKSSIASLFADTPSSSSSSTSSSQNKNTETKKPSSRLSSLFDDVPAKEETNTKSTEKPKSLLSGLFDDDKPENSNAADHSDKSCETKSDKIEIKKVFDFAGEMVTVSKEVSLDSAEAKKFLKSKEEGENKPLPESCPGNEKKRPSGLAGIVGSIGKKQKLGVLDKSKLDWNHFVKEEGISEQLKTHNKGKDGYVEKQMFLERADHRQFELEKAVRDKNRKSLMK